MNKQIPPINYLFMLAYAYDYDWDYLTQGLEESKIDELSLLEVEILMLVQWSSRIIRTNFYKSFNTKTAQTQRLRGRVLFPEDIKSGNMNSAQLTCKYGEVSFDVLVNQILLATLDKCRKLLHRSESKGSSKEKLETKLMKTLRRIKPEVSFIQLRREHFRKVTFSRENEHYRPVINLCKLIFDRKALDKSGEISGFGLPDNKKAQIFETFLHNYLHDEFERAPITVKPEKKKGWVERESDRDYIPGIQPDIVVREEDTPVMVLDAKFYKKAVKSGQYEGKDNLKTHSKNLYQILSYINYYNCDGMLVYAQTERGHFEQMAKINDEHYEDQGPDREFGFYTLDLSGGLDQLRKSMEQLKGKVRKCFMAESKV